jgi:hypothetical protein
MTREAKKNHGKGGDVNRDTSPCGHVQAKEEHSGDARRNRPQGRKDALPILKSGEERASLFMAGGISPF